VREIDWDGLHNARDLGGLGAVRPGRVLRSPRLDRLTAAGWAALQGAGVRTIIDLRNADEVRSDEVAVIDLPVGITRRALPIEDPADREFLRDWFSVIHSPEVWPEVLRRWPTLIVAVMRAITEAQDGAVLVHCAGGRDRTGLIAALLLSLAGVDHAEIVEDYLAGVRGANDELRRTEHREPPRTDEELLAWEAHTAAELLAFLHTTDVAAYLLANGFTPDELAQLRARLLGD
jgi:protein tyrosine/serine phosphatase